MPVPATGRPQTPAVARAIDGYLRRHGRRMSRVTAVTRRPCPYGSTAALEEIEARLSDGRTLQLVLKDLAPSVALSAVDVRPAELRDASREPLVYQHLLEPHGLGARCLEAVADKATGTFRVLLERIDGLQLCHIGSPRIWKDAARWLARLHTVIGPHAMESTHGGAVPLLVYDEPFYRRAMARAAERVGREPAARRARFERLAARHDAVLERLLGQPATFIHGECYASNILVRQPGDEVCPVDWEMAALGPAAFDLAALVSGDWPTDARRDILEAYRDEVACLGGAPHASDDLAAVVDCCRIHLALQLLAWHPTWQPPREHARDWLTVASAIQLPNTTQ